MSPIYYVKTVYQTSLLHTVSKHYRLGLLSHGGGGLELTKPTRESVSSRPKPCSFLSENFPMNLARLPLLVGSGRKKTYRGQKSQLSPQKPPGSRLWFSFTTVQHFPDSSAIELPSTLTESGAYSPDRACHGTLARAAPPYQAFRDSGTFLLRVTTSRRARNESSDETHRVNIIFNQPNLRRMSPGRLNREDSLLVPSFKGESSPTTAGRTLPHSSCPKIRFRRERASCQILLLP